MPGEFDFIDWVRTQQPTTARVPLPAGDDLAALAFSAADGLILVGIDQVLDGVHFDSAVHPPERIGRKAMNRNLSDCAAMACLPAAAVVSLALPRRGVGVDYAQRLYAGLRDAGDVFDCPVVGGDTGSWDGRLAVTVAVLGRSAGVEPVRRRGAQPGDAVYVTGSLGGSLLGRHLDFTPRVHEARALAAHGRVSAMIDLSDGLSRDAAHLARESGVSIVIDAARIPIHPDVARLIAARPDLARPPLEYALHDGEDYELCFTAPAPDAALPAVSALVTTAIRIGHVETGTGVWLDAHGVRRPLAAHAFEHRL